MIDKSEMTNDQRVKIERHRVREMLAKQIDDMTIDGGDIRFFSGALLVAAVQLHAELEGPESLDRTISKIASRELVRLGAAGRA